MTTNGAARPTDPTSPRQPRTATRAGIARTVLIAGPVVAALVAATTSSVRDQVGASNVGIALAIVVVAAALVDRWAGLATATVAAATFNFFHTEPYHSLRIREPHDVVIVALLAVLGLVVSDITAWRQRRDTIARRRRRALDAPAHVGEMLASPHPVSELWPSVTSAILDQLSLAECSFTSGSTAGLPTIGRVGNRHATNDDDGFVLPAGGAAMQVVADGVAIGHVVLRPAKGITSLWVERRVVVALADHIGIALTYTGHDRDGRRVPAK